MVSPDDETFYPKGRSHWRQWLQKHHDKKESVWLVCYKKKTEIPTVTWSDAVDEALCFGWIDSLRRPIDHEKFIQYFSRRKPTSVWSKINKDKIIRLTEEGLMTKAGHAVIDIAKENGTWTTLDEVEKLTIPKDLETAFKLKTGSKKFYLTLSKSLRKQLLSWIVMAKRDETRQKRIEEIVKEAEKKRVPKQFRN
jgi:uncharacterized protein YdeI (YjbR/CyaY-like superfamily)